MPPIPIRPIPKYKGPEVYGIINEINGKTYVGSSLCIRGRILCHRSLLRRGIHDNQYLQRAWNKWGERKFRVDVLEKCLPADLSIREQVWIDKLNVLDRNHGYNICLDTESGPMTGRNHSPESRAKMSAAQKGRDMTKVTEAAAEANRGKKRPPEVGAKISAARKGRKLNIGQRKKISLTH